MRTSSGRFLCLRCARMEPVSIPTTFDELPFRSDVTVTQLNGHSLIARRLDGPKRAPGWEMHPDSDELFHVVSGHMEVTVMTVVGPETVDLPAGTVYTIPRGHWHQPATLEPTSLLFMTPGESEWTDDKDPPPPSI